jgi:amidophosphoribosyltransferase
MQKNSPTDVTPAKAGAQAPSAAGAIQSKCLDSRLRGNDGLILTPAKAGAQAPSAAGAIQSKCLDSRLRGNDGLIVTPAKAGGQAPSVAGATPPKCLDSRLRGNDGLIVTPAKAGAQAPSAAGATPPKCLDSRLRGNDGLIEKDPLDVMHEECGIAAVYGSPDAARLVYLSLYALQHRGQEAAGIVTYNGTGLHTKLGMGLVSEVFNEPVLNTLNGDHAIGHVRYSTAGDSSVINCQPISVNTGNGSLAVAHNGNLTNAIEIRKKLEAQGAIFQTNSDTEVVLHLFAKSKETGFVRPLLDALRQLRGAYCFVFITKKGILAARDPYGVRPMALGKLGKSWVIASETSAFDLIGATYVRDIEPGELVDITSAGIKSHTISKVKNKAMCVFEYVYFSRPDSRIFGRNVYETRREMGRQLAREAPPPPNTDMVIPIPDSASVAAMGYAEVSGVRFDMGLIRSHYIGRTFIEPKQSIRDFGAKIKYNAVAEMMKGKKIVLVDDSIVRGTTSRKLVRMLRRVGVKEIHMRISSPPIISPCFYGIDTPSTKELVAAKMSIEKVRAYLEVDSLGYLSEKGMLAATQMPETDFCTACFTGKYPIALEQGVQSNNTVPC